MPAFSIVTDKTFLALPLLPRITDIQALGSRSSKKRYEAVQRATQKWILFLEEHDTLPNDTLFSLYRLLTCEKKQVWTFQKQDEPISYRNLASLLSSAAWNRGTYFCSRATWLEAYRLQDNLDRGEPAYIKFILAGYLGCTFSTFAPVVLSNEEREKPVSDALWIEDAREQLQGMQQRLMYPDPLTQLNSVARYTKVACADLFPWEHAFDPIPPCIHQIWVGSAPVPQNTYEWKRWALKHGWAYRLWREDDLDAFGLTNRFEYEYSYSRKNFQMASDVARYEIVERLGGMYVDADMVHKIGLDWTQYVQLTGFIGCPEKRFRDVNQTTAFVGNSMFLACPKHPILKRTIASLPSHVEQVHRLIEQDIAWISTAPTLLTKCLFGQYSLWSYEWSMKPRDFADETDSFFLISMEPTNVVYSKDEEKVSFRDVSYGNLIF